MINYSLQKPGSPVEIGKRAKRIRLLLGMTIDQAADAAGVSPNELSAMEAGEDVSLAAALAIHAVLSTGEVGEALFTRPRLRNIEEVVEFERRRLTNR